MCQILLAVMIVLLACNLFTLNQTLIHLAEQQSALCQVDKEQNQAITHESN